MSKYNLINSNSPHRFHSPSTLLARRPVKHKKICRAASERSSLKKKTSYRRKQESKYGICNLQYMAPSNSSHRIQIMYARKLNNFTEQETSNMKNHCLISKIQSSFCEQQKIQYKSNIKRINVRNISIPSSKISKKYQSGKWSFIEFVGIDRNNGKILMYLS